MRWLERRVFCGCQPLIAVVVCVLKVIKNVEKKKEETNFDEIWGINDDVYCYGAFINLKFERHGTSRQGYIPNKVLPLHHLNSK